MFHAFQIQYKENGVTVLTGPIVDQAALRGLLDHLFDLGLSILSIRNLGLYPESKVTFPHMWVPSFQRKERNDDKYETFKDGS
jgi:hypothetical protein